MIYHRQVVGIRDERLRNESMDIKMFLLSRYKSCYTKVFSVLASFNLLCQFLVGTLHSVDFSRIRYFK